MVKTGDRQPHQEKAVHPSDFTAGMTIPLAPEWTDLSGTCWPFSLFRPSLIGPVSGQGPASGLFIVFLRAWQKFHTQLVPRVVKDAAFLPSFTFATFICRVAHTIAAQIFASVALQHFACALLSFACFHFFQFSYPPPSPDRRAFHIHYVTPVRRADPAFGCHLLGPHPTRTSSHLLVPTFQRASG